MAVRTNLRVDKCASGISRRDVRPVDIQFVNAGIGRCLLMEERLDGVVLMVHAGIVCCYVFAVLHAGLSLHVSHAVLCSLVLYAVDVCCSCTLSRTHRTVNRGRLPSQFKIQTATISVQAVPQAHLISWCNQASTPL
eukprot:3909007-Rhodomonas_salina.2